MRFKPYNRKHNTKLYRGINIGRQSKNSNTKGDKNTEPITKLYDSFASYVMTRATNDKNQERKVFRAGVALQCGGVTKAMGWSQTAPLMVFLRSNWWRMLCWALASVSELTGRNLGDGERVCCNKRETPITGRKTHSEKDIRACWRVDYLLAQRDVICKTYNLYCSCARRRCGKVE